MNKFKFSNILLYIFCLEILCFSGGLRFIEYPRACQLIWITTCALMFFKKTNFLNRTVEGNILVIFLVIWAFVSTVVINEKTDNTYFLFMTYPLGMILAIPYLRFSKFRIYLLRSLNALMIVSILVHVGYNLNLIPVSHVEINNIIRNLSLLIFNVKWGEDLVGIFSFTRFSSIYWEPGMCQIIIMFVLVLFTDDIKKNLLNLSYIFKKYGILILSILLTGSTMGYLVFALYIISLFVFSSGKKIALFPFYVLVGVVLSYSIYNTSVVQEKLEQRNDISDRTSYAIRMADNIACLNVAIEYPIFGLGCNSKKLGRTLINAGNTTASNGWLYSAAQMGFVYIFVLLLAIYRNLARMNLGLPAFFPLIVLFTSQSNEAATYFPYMWIYACSFLSYK